MLIFWDKNQLEKGLTSSSNGLESWWRFMVKWRRWLVMKIKILKNQGSTFLFFLYFCFNVF